MPACCRGGVGFESCLHFVMLKTLKMVPTAAYLARDYSESRGNALAYKQAQIITDKGPETKGFGYLLGVT